MQKARRALAAIDRVILALRRGYFPFTSTEQELLADDLTPARDYYASLIVKAKYEKRSGFSKSEIRALMDQDIRRK